MSSRTFVLTTLALSLSLASCAQSPPSPTGTEPPGEKAVAPAGGGVQQATSLKPLAQTKFGAPISETSNTPIDSIMKEPTRFTSQTVRTEGVVSAVCKSMGCWMEISDPAGNAHIKMAGHSFFVPKDASGHRAVVQGKVTSVDPAKDESECAKEAQEQTGKVARVEIEATGVEFVD